MEIHRGVRWIKPKARDVLEAEARAGKDSKA